ncbi:MAG: RagB/SusD family nutrient uptake outer membrane protein [Bacteroidales bacterium]|nr:RagB/SusD family nutrient uptake outer membrane protein [Bacteroidales bacterium]
MKKYIIILFFGLSSIILNSCLEDYLDKAPESGLSEDEVFSKYLNFKQYFNSVYDGQVYFEGINGGQLKGWYNYNLKTTFYMYFVQWGQKYTWESMTDMSDVGRLEFAQPIKSGNIAADIYKFITSGAHRPILRSMFIVIRTCNLTLQNIGKLKSTNQEDIDDFIAQAHFVRAYAHFELMRIWGGMPYITKVIGPDDQWDMPRLSRHETLLKVAADLDTAALYFEKAGRMRRDAGPGQVGHLSDPDQARPNGVAAKAIKSRALLYAASPLNNEMGQTDWEEAAKASWEAIEIAEQYGYGLLSAADYKKNYIGTTYTNEQLWGWYAGTFGYSGIGALDNGVFAGSKGGNSGECPTQNTVDKFETKWGDPLNTQAERDAAAALGHYNEQDPYKDRDPRFYIDIIYNTAPIPGFGTAKMYYEMTPNGAKYSELLDRNYIAISYTGYYQRKRWGEQSIKNKTTPQYTDPIIRLGELYLNYAEAANEAYGPNTPAPNSSMTAVQAINKIRNRIGQADVLPQFTANKDIFRARIKNERTIELCFEGGHYYHDIRRWKDAPAVMTGGPLIAMDVEKVPVSGTYPTGYKYTRMPMPANRQSQWKDAMYFIPFLPEDAYKMKNFVQNEQW